jgi:hypothetical protein
MELTRRSPLIKVFHMPYISWTSVPVLLLVGILVVILAIR